MVRVPEQYDKHPRRMRNKAKHILGRRTFVLLFDASVRFRLTERHYTGLAPEIPEDLYMLIKKVCEQSNQSLSPSKKKYLVADSW